MSRYIQTAGITSATAALSVVVTTLKPEDRNTVEKIAAIKFRLENPVCLLLNQIVQTELLSKKNPDVVTQLKLWRQQLTDLRFAEMLSIAGNNPRRRLMSEISYWEAVAGGAELLPLLREKLEQVELAEMRRAWLLDTETDARRRTSREIQFLKLHNPADPDLPKLEAHLQELDHATQHQLAETAALSSANEEKYKLEAVRYQKERERLNGEKPPKRSSKPDSSKKTAVSSAAGSWQTLAQVCRPWFPNGMRKNKFGPAWDQAIMAEIKSNDAAKEIPQKICAGRLQITHAIRQHAPRTFAALQKLCEQDGPISPPPPPPPPPVSAEGSGLGLGEDRPAKKSKRT